MNLLSVLIDIRRPVESCTQGHPQIMGCVNTMGWFPEMCYVPELLKRLPARSKIIAVLLETLRAILH